MLHDRMLLHTCDQHLWCFVEGLHVRLAAAWNRKLYDADPDVSALYGYVGSQAQNAFSSVKVEHTAYQTA